MLRKFLAVICAVFLTFSLCGCDIFTADTAELLSPPELTGDISPIAEAIKESSPLNYTLEYPSRGDYRSAIVQHDVNKDGIFEAFAFYSTKERESNLMHINVITFKDDNWSSVAIQSIAAGGIDRIDFSDLDNDGIDEILVGWEIYGTSELQLAVYSLGEQALTQRMLEKYSHYLTCDLDSNDRNEVLILRSNPAQAQNTAHLFSLTSVGVSQIASCELDNTSKTLNHPIAAQLSSGKNAVYIDEIKGLGAVTEVIFLEKGQLINPLRDAEAKETSVTLRSATLETTDINNDGILEIPIQSEVPTVTKTGIGEKLYLTNWCSFNGESLTNQMTTFINLTDGYYYTIPQKWLGKIAILKDTQNLLLEIYRYNPEENTTAERLLYFKAVKKSDWDNGVYKSQDVTEIVNNGETSFICYISENAKAEGIDVSKIKNDFKIF